MDRYIDLRPLEQVSRGLTAIWWLYLIQALTLIGLGIAVLIWPELVAILVAAFLIASGVVVLTIAWRTWSVKREYDRFQRLLLEPAR